MKTEKYIIEIEMPDGDGASPSWVCEVLQNDADVEDEDRWKVSVKESWKPSDEQMQILQYLCETSSHQNEKVIPTLESLYQDLKKLREE